jgi:hypothetical protein
MGTMRAASPATTPPHRFIGCGSRVPLDNPAVLVDKPGSLLTPRRSLYPSRKRYPLLSSVSLGNASSERLSARVPLRHRAPLQSRQGSTKAGRSLASASRLRASARVGSLAVTRVPALAAGADTDRDSGRRVLLIVGCSDGNMEFGVRIAQKLGSGSNRPESSIQMIEVMLVTNLRRGRISGYRRIQPKADADQPI